MLIRGKGSIEEKIKHETETRRIVRSQEDMLYHGRYFRSTKDQASRGDYKFCREGDKYLSAIKRFPRDKEKISAEYQAWQKSQRKYG